MATQDYYDWDAKGRPYTLARPLKMVQTTLRGYGLTVYDYPNEEHQKASNPQDHTPYSHTGWPGTSKKYIGHALDVMPRSDSYEHRKENADIARQMIKDRDAQYPGAMWIKYINWTDENGVCRQESWKDKRTSSSSSDKGHIHASGRSDIDNDVRADGYDPVARMRGQGEDMDFNQSAKLDGIFNLLKTVTLDTDGIVDGKGGLASFEVPITKVIESMAADIETIKNTKPPAGSTLTDADVNRIAQAVLKLLKPELEPAAFSAAQRAEKE